MANDIESFVLGWRLEEGSDGIEFGLRGPWSASGQFMAPLPQLTLTQIVCRVDVVKLMVDASGLNKATKPFALGDRVTGKVEDHRNAPRQ